MGCHVRSHDKTKPMRSIARDEPLAITLAPSMTKAQIGGGCGVGFSLRRTGDDSSFLRQRLRDEGCVQGVAAANHRNAALIHGNIPAIVAIQQRFQLG